MSPLYVDLLGAEIKYYNAGGLRTRCIEAGSGQAIIFLHGTGGHAEAFARNIVPLSDEFRACAIDMLGHGFTDKPEQGYLAADFARHLVDFMDAAGIDKAIVAGESLGGWVGMWTALLHPDRVSKLIQIVGTGLTIETDDESRKHHQEGSKELVRLGQQFAQNQTRENLIARIRWLFHDYSQITDELIDVRWRIGELEPGARHAQGKAGGPGGVTGEGQGLGEQQLRSLHVPVLYLWTDHNPTITSATARRAAAITPNAEFIEMKGCAHWPQWEKRDEFNQIVREFARK